MEQSCFNSPEISYQVCPAMSTISARVDCIGRHDEATICHGIITTFGPRIFTKGSNASRCCKNWADDSRGSKKNFDRLHPEDGM